MDDPGPEGEGTLRGLPLQRHRRELGAEAARLGDADGEFADRGRHQDAGGAGAGPVPGAGGGEDEEEDGGGGEGGGTVPSAQWAQLLPGEFTDQASGLPVFSQQCSESSPCFISIRVIRLGLFMWWLFRFVPINSVSNPPC